MSSAAMCRRMLQQLLREEYKIRKRNLYDEIEEFINLPQIPSYLSTSVDAIRVIGNLAAHPIKNENTGEVVEVEEGEAEWLIEVYEALLNFVFVQPIKLKERREKINEKLREIEKPEMLG